jgi:large subunit ribosomal protein L4e
MTQTNVYSVKGEVSGTVDVPAVFSSEYRPDVIKKAILAAAANGRQPYGPSEHAGMRHSTSTWGKGRGVSRVQRVKAGKRATESPNNISGRRAHPPRPERIWHQKVNGKELKLAKFSAIAATGCADCVRERGHQFDDSVSFPIVMEDEFQNMISTSEINSLFESIGIGYDLERAKEGTKIRAGRGKMRNRKYRTPVSILIVVSETEAPVFKGAKNLPGVEVQSVGSLSASVLAPGGDAGRLTVYTKSAIAKMGEWTL